MKKQTMNKILKDLNVDSNFSLFQPGILSNDWNEAIFQDRNKDYGAFNLRVNYQHNLSIAFLVSVSFIITFFLSYAIFRSSDKIIIDDVFTVAPTQPKEFLLPELKKEVYEQKQTQKTNGPVAISKDSIINDVIKDSSSLTFGSGKGKDSVGDKKPIGGGKGPVTGGFGNSGGENNDTLLSWVPEMPEFPGGMQALNKLISKKIRTNNLWRENGFDGKVIYEFVIGKDGNVRNIKIISDGVKYGIAELNLSIFEEMPKWKAGKNNGNPVSVLFRLPVKFVKE